MTIQPSTLHPARFPGEDHDTYRKRRRNAAWRVKDYLRRGTMFWNPAHVIRYERGGDRFWGPQGTYRRPLRRPGESFDAYRQRLGKIAAGEEAK